MVRAPVLTQPTVQALQGNLKDVTLIGETDSKTCSKVIHNMFYSTMGVVQFTVWEAIFLHCYATNRLPYLSDEQVFTKSKKYFPPHGSNFFLPGLLEPLEHNNVHPRRLLGSPLPRVPLLFRPPVHPHQGLNHQQFQFQLQLYPHQGLNHYQFQS